jgi:rod shape-determining protein MreD
MRRVILSAVAVIVALVLQLTVVNRLPLPGGAPDLVLLVVVALGICGSPASGALTGFLAGLSLDIAPPGSYLIGEYALVFCVVGYGCGRLRSPHGGDSVWRPIGWAVVAAAVGEALAAALGRLIGDPQVTWSAVRQVLPSSVAYDAVVSPFVLYLVLRALAWADRFGPASEISQQVTPAQARAAASALPGGAGLLGGAGWLTGPQSSRAAGSNGPAGRVPRLRDAAARTGDGWIGGGPASWRTAAWRLGRRPLRLRPGAGQAGSAAATAMHRDLPRREVNLRLRGGRRRDGMVGNALGTSLGGPGASSPAVRRRRAGSGPAGPAFRGTGHGPPGKAFRSRGEAGLAGSAFRGKRSVPRGSAFRGTGSVPRGPAFRGAGQGPSGSAFRGKRSVPRGPAFHGSGSVPRGSAFRGGSSGPRGSAFRGPGHGPPGAASRPRSASRPAFHRSRPGARQSLLAGSGAPFRTPRFRPDSRIPGGSAVGSPFRRTLPGRPVPLRLRAPRRRDGVLGSGLARGTQGRRIFTARPARPARPVRLRLGSLRRRDGTVGGLAPAGRSYRQRSRRSAPRFRASSGGRAALAGRRPALGSGKQARFRSGRRSLLSACTGGRLGARSTVWRIGSRHTGGRP